MKSYGRAAAKPQFIFGPAQKMLSNGGEAGILGRRNLTVRIEF
jgi:hypothetical protein